MFTIKTYSYSCVSYSAPSTVYIKNRGGYCLKLNLIPYLEAYFSTKRMIFISQNRRKELKEKYKKGKC